MVFVHFSLLSAQDELIPLSATRDADTALKCHMYRGTYILIFIPIFIGVFLCLPHVLFKCMLIKKVNVLAFPTFFPWPLLIFASV